MLQQTTVGDRIIEMVRANPDCTLEEVTQQLPELNWTEVFLEVDRLSRLGRLRMVQKLVQPSVLRFTTTLRLP